MSESNRRRWREYLCRRSINRFLENWAGIWEHCEFFWAYLKVTNRAEWEGAQSKEPVIIWYLLETHDDWANAPPDIT